MLKKLIVIIGLFFLTPCLSNAQVASLDQYTKFLEDALKQDVSDEATAEFYKRSFAYWMANKVDYNDNPAKYAGAMDLYHEGRELYTRDRTIAIDRFESTIEIYRRFDNRNKFPSSPILFVGSSSIVFWETANSFPDLPVVNRGFGGASLPEIIHYYDDVIKKHNPSMMIVYCDIDVENGRSPEFSVNAFKELVDKVEADFPNMPIILISMKPTLIDDVLGKEVRANKLKTNQKLIEYAMANENLHYVDISSPMLRADGSLKSEIFLADGMHLNPLGYELWDPIMRAEMNRIRGR
tara:strand:- start:256649 stop:257533 length:885 start_codon:yes stop_codon:yes gene_type:complete